MNYCQMILEAKFLSVQEKSYEIWKNTMAQKSAQLIFCDLSTPKGDGSFNVYDDLKQKLMDKGVPEKEIAFIHDANTETKKAELFGKVKSGQVRFFDWFYSEDGCWYQRAGSSDCSASSGYWLETVRPGTEGRTYYPAGQP